MRRKKWLSIVITGLLMALCLTGCGDEKDKKSSSEVASSEPTETPQNQEEDPKELLSGKHHVKIKIKDHGTIDVELDADIAPITTTNFIKLAQSGFYDGLTFHRIISGFMIQGGDPNGDGTGGSEKTIKGEFESNGVKNSISHTRGVISMARSNDPNSASSQFFIMHADSTHLDGDYAAFGHVTDGMQIVDQMCEYIKPVDENGTVEKKKQPVIHTIEIVD